MYRAGRFSTTSINHVRSTDDRLCIHYNVLGGTKSDLMIDRKAYNALARATGGYLQMSGQTIGSIRRMAEKITDGGCPCNLAKRLGLGNDANGLYMIFRLWEDSGLLHREGNVRSFYLGEGEKVSQTRSLFTEGASLIEIGEFDADDWAEAA